MPPPDNDGKASDEYRIACHAAIQANKLDFVRDDTSDSTFDQCTVSAKVCPDGGMPQDKIATLRMIAIAESRVDPETFEDDIMDIVVDDSGLTEDLLSPDGTCRSDRWGRGSQYEGTGVWHSEFGQGLLVYIEEIDVKHSLRGMGIGTKLFNRALDWVGEKARELGQDNDFNSYLVVAPGFLRQDLVREFGEGDFYTGGYGERQAEVDALREKLVDNSVAFWRKQGFRRVGLSQFWAYATNLDHPSRQLTAEEDAKRDDIVPPDFDEIDLLDFFGWPRNARTHPHTTILKPHG